jgi:hypothetical protein
MKGKYLTFSSIESFNVWHQAEMAKRGLPNEETKTYSYVDPLILDSGEVLALIPVKDYVKYNTLVEEADLKASGKIKEHTDRIFWNNIKKRGENA